MRGSFRPASRSATCDAIGSSTPWRAASASAACDVRTPSATMRVPSRISCSGRPCASSTPTRRLRLGALVQVSTRSPRPASPDSVSRCAPAAHASRDISASPRVMSPGLRVVAQPQPFDQAGGDGNHVLQRAADLDARHVARAVEPEVRARGTPAARRPRPPASRDATAMAVGSSRASSDAKLGPDSTATRTPGPQLLLEDLRHAEERLLLEPLGGADDDRIGGRTAALARRSDLAHRRATAPP